MRLDMMTTSSHLTDLHLTQQHTVVNILWLHSEKILADHSPYDNLELLETIIYRSNDSNLQKLHYFFSTALQIAQTSQLLLHIHIYYFWLLAHINISSEC